MPSFTKGDVTIQYEEAGSGFPLLVTPGGGLNSVASGWPRQVINAFEEFSSDFRCITMDQRNAGGGSTGPVQVDDPWGAFADDQLSLLDHLGVRQFGFIGFCIGGPFALRLMKNAPNRIVAAVLGRAGMTGRGAELCASEPYLTQYAPSVEAPVLFAMQWDDELFDRAGQFDLFDRIGSDDKRLHAYPGAHADSSPEALEVQAEFLGRYF